MTPRLKIAYDKEIINKLMSKLSVKNKHQVPKIEKIILNIPNKRKSNNFVNKKIFFTKFTTWAPKTKRLRKSLKKN